MLVKMVANGIEITNTNERMSSLLGIQSEKEKVCKSVLTFQPSHFTNKISDLKPISPQFLQPAFFLSVNGNKLTY